jgi:phenylpyruvate tautomerase PptA (4-oxalocrotonate tautomerase family)
MNVTIPKVTSEQRSAVVKNLTDTVGNVLGLPTEVRRRISVRLDLYDTNEVARDGRMLSAKDNPLCHIDLFVPELNVDQKRDLVRHLTTALMDSIGMRREQRDDVFITIHQFRPENIASGGRLLGELAYA